MKIHLILPGHGSLSENAEQDIVKALKEARRNHKESLSHRCSDPLSENREYFFRAIQNNSPLGLASLSRL